MIIMIIKLHDMITILVQSIVPVQAAKETHHKDNSEIPHNSQTFLNYAAITV